MKKTLYLAMAIIGLVIPYSFLIDYLMKNGLDVDLFIDDIFHTSMSTFFVVNVIITVIVVILFIIVDSKAIRVQFITVPIVTTLLVGPSCGLPLYLYLREIERASWVETIKD